MHCSLCILCYLVSGTLSEVLGKWMGMWSSKGERTALTARISVLPLQALSDASYLTAPSPLFFCLLTFFHLWLLRSTFNLMCLFGELNMQL